MHGTYGGGVFERRVDLGLFEEDVAAAGAPQHALERRDALAQDHARHEPATDGAHSVIIPLSK